MENHAVSDAGIGGLDGGLSVSLSADNHRRLSRFNVQRVNSDDIGMVPRRRASVTHGHSPCSQFTAVPFPMANDARSGINTDPNVSTHPNTDTVQRGYSLSESSNG